MGKLNTKYRDWITFLNDWVRDQDFSSFQSDVEDYFGSLNQYYDEQLRPQWEELLDLFDSLPDEFEVYRMITINNEDEFIKSLKSNIFGEYKGIGIYWSWDKSGADAYWGKWGKGYEQVLLIGKVNKYSVDWNKTILANMRYSLGEQEKEITLENGSSITITSIEYNNKIYPINKTVTAIKKTAGLTKQDIYEFYELEYKIDQLKRRNPEHPAIMRMEGRLNEVCDRLKRLFVKIMKKYLNSATREPDNEFEYSIGERGDKVLEWLEFGSNELSEKVSQISGALNWVHDSGSMIVALLNDDSVDDTFLWDLTEGTFIPQWNKQLQKIASKKTPQVWYHGVSYHMIDKELVDGDWVGWFTEDKDYAEQYLNDEGEVYDIYLDIQNPFALKTPAETEMTLEEFEQSTGFKLKPEFRWEGHLQQKNPIWEIYSHTDFIEQLKNKGYDGFQTIEYGHKCILPFFESQIKKVSIKKLLRKLVDIKSLKEIKSAFEEDYTEDSPDYSEMTPEDYENIRQTDKVTSDEATDMSKIPHPQKYEEVEGKGMFFIGGDNMGIGLSGEESLHGADYAKAFQGWAVGKDRLQQLEKKAEEGYFYVGIVIYKDPITSTFRNPAFLSSLDRKLKYISTGLGINYDTLKNEAHKSLVTKKLDKDPTPSMFGYLGERVPEDIRFYRKVIDLLKKKETEHGKQTIFMNKILEQVADEASSKKNRGAYGKIIGVGKFAEGIVGEDRIVKHELYPEEVIFSNYIELPDPIDFTELVPALREIHTDVEEKHLLGTLWARLNGYNLTLPRSIPLVQELMDLADRGDIKLQKSAGLDWNKLQKLARLKKTANLEVGTRDGQKVMLKLEDLPDSKQRENFLRHYMNGTFEVDGVWYHDLDAIEQGKARIHFNNLKYL